MTITTPTRTPPKTSTDEPVILARTFILPRLGHKGTDSLTVCYPLRPSTAMTLRQALSWVESLSAKGYGACGLVLNEALMTGEAFYPALFETPPQMADGSAAAGWQLVCGALVHQVVPADGAAVTLGTTVLTAAGLQFQFPVSKTRATRVDAIDGPPWLVVEAISARLDPPVRALLFDPRIRGARD